ncbi:Carbohydrate family 9 binding domain-like [Abditibacterium utsteinense]|uniref:Carbohydrate family 9 binding domain-like n=1 Tax=Abditibacterium utsteinense TaxID=1960156 RepID=A0A2S8SPG0_9BACT|nr:sugar-binding protein [Abditibacterium utsteinense]PQV62664.1 Carbohydrate family 9 binding domain-like [Abditibacterium utsteinense]
MMRFSGFTGTLLPLIVPCIAIAPLVTATAHAQTTTTAAPVAPLAWNLDLNRAAQPLYERGDAAFAVGIPQKIGTTVPRLELWNHRGEKLADLMASPPAADGSITWKLPSDRMGYFEIRPAAGSLSWPALGSRPAGKLTFAVVDKIVPNPSRDYKTHFLSIQGSSYAGKLNTPPSPNVHRYIGLQAQAMDYSWYKLQPKAGDFSSFDAYFAADKAPEQIRQDKIWPYFYISKNPTWAVDPARLSESGRKGVATSNLPPQDLKQYEAYLERVVPHIAKSYNYLPYRVYEVMWEPVIPWGWHGTAQEIVDMFEVVHRVVHKYDPNGRVSGPTLSSFGDIPLYENLLKLGLGKTIDVSGWHMYSGYPAEKAGIPAAIARIRALDQQYIGRDLPLFGTEFGLPEAKAGSAENQAYGMTAATLILKAEGVQQHTLFYLSDYASEPGYGLFYTDVSGTPYAPDKISPKPAIPMLRAAIDQIGTARGVGKLDYLGPDVWGYVFQDEESGQFLTAIWDASGNNRSVSLDTGAGNVQVVDSFGNREARATKDGLISLQLRRSPVYVRGVSAELFAPAKGAPLLQNNATWRVFRGQKTLQTLQLGRALPQKMVDVSVALPAEIATSSASAKMSGTPGAKAQIALQIAPNAPLGTFVGSVRVRGANGTVGRALQRVEVLPELQIAPAQLQGAGKQWTLQSRVKNVSPTRWVGQAALNFQNASQTRSVALSPGQETRLQFAIAAPSDVSQKAPSNLELRSSTGSRLNMATPLSFFAVQKADANDVWNRMALMPIRATEKTIYRTFAQSKFGGDADLSAQAGYAHDANNLYVQYVVEDDLHRNSASSTQMWKQDSIQLAFDVAPGREISTNDVAEAFERTSSEWGFAFTSRGPEIYLWKPPGGSSLVANSLVPDAGVRLEGGTVGTTTTYHITIPWNVIDPRNQHRDALGIAATINDSDSEPGYLDRRALLLFGGIIADKDVANYGRAALQ